MFTSCVKHYNVSACHYVILTIDMPLHLPHVFTGHIPQQSQQYGGTYATTSFYGLSDFANIQKKVKRDAAILRSINHGPLEQQDMFAVSCIIIFHYLHRLSVRANIHLGGQTEFCPNGERKLFVTRPRQGEKKIMNCCRAYVLTVIE